jgi:type IV secretory pathway VirB4 component
MIAIYYIVFVLLALIFLKQMYSFLKYFYSRPLLTNTYAEFIPSKSIINDYMIENKDGSYSSILELKGFSYFKAENLEVSSADNLKIKERALNFNDLKENIHIKFIFKRFKIQDGYSNKNYIEVTSNSKVHLKENSSRLLSSLSEFKPHLLENKELLDFLFFNCNLVDKSLKIDEEINIHDICSYSNIEFSNDCGELNNFDTKKFFKCFSFNFGSAIDDKYFSKMITSNIQFDFIINTKFFDKLTAQSVISENKKNISASNDASKDGIMSRFFNSSNKKIQEVAEAQEIVRNEESNLSVCDTFIIVFADTKEELETSITILKELISKFEIFLVEEVKLLNFFFLQRLIGFKLHHTMKFLISHTDTLIYAKQVLSNTIAGLIDYIDMPTGLSKCDWGDKPISSFSTNYNNLYNFYTHVSEEKASVGHGVIVAPTGGGKTTFVQYLMKGILDNYKDVDVYSFDRHNGISVFTNWVGGKDINFLDLAINPLQVDLEQEDNKEFLHNFLSMIAKPSTPE